MRRDDRILSPSLFKSVPLNLFTFLAGKSLRFPCEAEQECNHQGRERAAGISEQILATMDAVPSTAVRRFCLCSSPVATGQLERSSHSVHALSTRCPNGG